MFSQRPGEKRGRFLKDEEPPQGTRLLGTGDVVFGLMELVALLFLVLFTLCQTEPQLTEREGTQRRWPQVQMFASINGL